MHYYLVCNKAVIFICTRFCDRDSTWVHALFVKPAELYHHLIKLNKPDTRPYCIWVHAILVNENQLSNGITLIFNGLEMGKVIKSNT